ncbi:MAG: hypothetical protein MHM6MM_009489 [Cercozoa sp. M6MM]
MLLPAPGTSEAQSDTATLRPRHALPQRPYGTPSAEESALTQSNDSGCPVCSEELRTAPCVRMRCGHVYHLHCARTKLESRWSGLRITLGFANCALCRRALEHAALEDQTRELSNLALFLRADLGEERLAAAAESDAAAEATQPTRFEPAYWHDVQLLGPALREWAYYMCSRCDTPFFSGRYT